MSIIRLYIEVLLLFLANLMLSENAGIKLHLIGHFQ